MDELVIKVPSPFVGVEDLGFTARYPAQPRHERLRDIPLIIEGPARPLSRLVDRLNLFVEKDALLGTEGDDEAYAWTMPVQLADELVVLAFRDRSIDDAATDAGASTRQYIWNLVRPLAFTFLRDCVRIGSLRLVENIAVVLDSGRPPLVDLELRRSAISVENGSLLLTA